MDKMLGAELEDLPKFLSMEDESMELMKRVAKWRLEKGK